MRRPRLFGPLLGYEMLTSARKPRYYALRCVYVCLTLFLLYISFETVAGGRTGAQIGIRERADLAAMFFVVFGCVQIGAILVLTPALLAPAITTEKERRTIDYLLTTDLTNCEIVLGKWLARICLALLPVVAGLGTLGACQLFGGVSLEHLAILTAISIGAMASAGSISMLVSVRTKKTREALIAAYFFVAVLSAAPFLASFFVAGGFHYARQFDLVKDSAMEAKWLAVVDSWNGAEPIVLFVKLIQLNQPGPGGVEGDLLYFGSMHAGLSGLCLLWAILGLRRRYRIENASAVGRRRWRLRPNAWLPNGVFERLPPMLGKELRFAPAAGALVSLLVAALTLLWPLGILLDYHFFANVSRNEFAAQLPGAVGGAQIALSFWTCLAILFRAATSVSIERNQDTWVSLLSTPLSVREILLGKAVGAMRPILPSTLLLVPFFFAAFGDRAFYTSILTTFLTTTVVAFFLACVGVFFSLTRRTPGGAIGVSFLVLLLVNGLGQMLFGLLFGTIAVAVKSIPTGLERILLYMIVESVPSVLIIGSSVGLRDHDSLWSAETFALTAFFWLFWLASYAALGFFLLNAAANHFFHERGRNG